MCYHFTAFMAAGTRLYGNSAPIGLRAFPLFPLVVQLRLQIYLRLSPS